MATVPVVPVAVDPEFRELYSGSKPARVLAYSELPLFHEAGVWIPATNEWLVTSNRLEKNSANASEKENESSTTPCVSVQITALHFSGKIRRLSHLETIVVMANGGTEDLSGGAYLLSQGLGSQSGAIFHIDAHLRTATEVGQNSHC